NSVPTGRGGEGDQEADREGGRGGGGAFEAEIAAENGIAAGGDDTSDRAAADLQAADLEAEDVALRPVPGDVEGAGRPDAALQQGDQRKEHGDQQQVDDGQRVDAWVAEV